MMVFEIAAALWLSWFTYHTTTVAERLADKLEKLEDRVQIIYDSIEKRHPDRS